MIGWGGGEVRLPLPRRPLSTCNLQPATCMSLQSQSGTQAVSQSVSQSVDNGTERERGYMREMRACALVAFTRHFTVL